MEDRIIDIDEEKERAGMETTSYEQILLKQIRETAVLLSKPREGGQTIEKVIRGKTQVVVIPDVREAVIRSVNTLRSLLMPFIKKRFEDEFEIIDDKNIKIKKNLDDKFIKIQGKTKRVKEFDFIPPNNPIIKMRMEFECDVAEELYALLVKAFHKVKSDLASYETE